MGGRKELKAVSSGREKGVEGSKVGGRKELKAVSSGRKKGVEGSK